MKKDLTVIIDDLGAFFLQGRVENKRILEHCILEREVEHKAQRKADL